MTDPPGTFRRIDPDAEVARLAEARRNPLARVWGVRHPLDGSVTVPAPIGRNPWGSKVEAERDLHHRIKGCAYCTVEGGPEVDDSAHTLAYQDVSPWRDE